MPTCETSSSTSSRCFGARRAAGHRPVRRHGRRHRPRDAARARAPRRRARSPRRSSTPTATHRCTTRRPSPSTMPESFKESYRALMDGEWYRLDLPTDLGGYGAPAVAALGRRRADAGRQPGAVHVLPAARLRGHRAPATAHRAAEDARELMIEQQWGATMVLTEPDAGSDVGAGRTKADPAARRQLAPRGREALHHLRRARPHREHRPPGAGPPRGARQSGHQGSVAVRGAEVPLRPGDRRARRAQRRVRHRTSNTRWG